jgi:hypothetical protein
VRRRIVVEAPEVVARPPEKPVEKPLEKVVEKPVEPPKSTVVAGPAPTPPAAVVPPKTEVKDAAAEVRDVLACYRAGHEAKSLPRLKSCWSMDPQQDEPDVALLFDSCKTLSVKIEIESVSAAAGKGSAKWKETITGDCGFISEFPPVSYQGVFQQRHGGPWRMVNRRKL